MNVAVGGTPAYSYTWTTPAPATFFTPIINGQCAGTYTLNVKDGNGCTTQTVVIVAAPNTLTVLITPTSPSCNGGCNGTITSTVTGGTPTYTYNWSTGSNATSIGGLCIGNYSLTITDANGCQKTTSTTIVATPPIVITTTAVPTTCAGFCNGQAFANASGGTPPFIYSWNTIPVTTNATGSVSALCSGNYVVTVTDSKGCIQTANVIITSPPVLSVAINSVVPSCNICIGAATITPSGGNPGYSYTWTPVPGSGQGTPTPSGVPLAGSASPGSGTISSYQWYLDGSAISGGSALNYTATQSGNYNLVVENSTGCSTASPAEAVIVQLSSCVVTTPTGLNSVTATPLSEVIEWGPVAITDSIIVRYKREGSTVYNYIHLLNTGQTSLILQGLQPGTRYSWRIKTACGITSGNYSPKNYFTTSPGPVVNPTSIDSRSQQIDFSGLEDDLTAYPLPASDKINLYFYSDDESSASLEIMNLEGRLIRQESISLVDGDNIIELDVNNLLPGIYFAGIRLTDQLLVKRIMVQR